MKVIPLAAIYRNRQAEGETKPVLMPWFVSVFVSLMVIGNLGWIPQGMQTVGIKPIVVMVGETIFLAALVIGVLTWLK